MRLLLGSYSGCRYYCLHGYICGCAHPRLDSSSNALITIREGAPTIHLSGVTIAGTIKLESGRLEVRDCRFVGSATEASGYLPMRALVQSGGLAVVLQSR